MTALKSRKTGSGRKKVEGEGGGYVREIKPWSKEGIKQLAAEQKERGNQKGQFAQKKLTLDNFTAINYPITVTCCITTVKI